MFSSIYSSLDTQVRALLARAVCPSAGRTRELLARSVEQPLTLAEIAELIEIGNHPQATEAFHELRAFTRQRFRRATGNRVRYVAPVYISSHCVDRCGYCTFSAARQNVARRRLDLDQVRYEVEGLIESGAKVIEIVLATDPELTWQALAPYIEMTRQMLTGVPGSAVLLCSDYFPLEAYAELHARGLWGMVQWDETLDADAYRRWHSTSPRKHNFAERMDNHHRAMQAGLEIATGSLFGLADYRYEALMQIAKARHLAATCGRKPFVFGTPRIKPGTGAAGPQITSNVSDHAHATALMVYRIAEPAVGRWLQTRETFDFNLDNLHHHDVFTYRCGDVRPGGYNILAASSDDANGQFQVHEMTQAQAEARLLGEGFEIDYAWVRESVFVASQAL
jgi:2-iminoacetate synthase